MNISKYHKDHLDTTFLPKSFLLIFRLNLEIENFVN